MSVEMRMSEVTLPTGLEKVETRFAVSTWSNLEQDEKPKALVFISHGFAEYVVEANYGPLASLLASKSCLVFGHDHLGHGRSEGERVQARSDIVHDFAMPIVHHCRLMRGKYEDVPLFMVAHSMGGLFGLQAYLEQQTLIDFMVLYAPCIEVDPSIDTRLNRFLSKFLSPILPSVQASGVNIDAVTPVAETRERLQNDPLEWHGGIKLRFGNRTLKALSDIQTRAKDVKLPVLMVQGDNDLIVRPQANHKFFEEIDSDDKTLIKYPNGYHGLLIDQPQIAQKTTEDIVQWIEERIKTFQKH